MKEWLCSICLLVVTALLGCAANNDQPGLVHQLEPGDFVADPDRAPQRPPPQPTARVTPAGTQTDPQPPATAVPSPPAQPPSEPLVEHRTPTPRPRNASRFTVDAMVGQVNGKAIYANTVFEPIVEQLATLGRALPPGEFQRRAHQLIQGRLSQIIADSLLLGEAENRLTAQEHAGLRNILKQQREELIRFWGKGSVAVAEENLVRQTSKGLDDTLNETRQRMLVQRYLQQKLLPQIHVRRKDVERHYSEHMDEYQPPVSRTLRLIYVKNAQDADQIDGLLSGGASFDQAAASPPNQYRSDAGGLMSEPAVGDHVFSQAPLNEALKALGPGEHSQRIETDGRTWWVAVESIERPAGRSLTEVQLEIEDLLRRRQFQQLTQRYRQELFKTGSYNSIEAMGKALLEIAMSRFAAVN